MRKSKVNYDAAMKQFDLLLPDSMKDDYKNALTKCKDSANGEKNACEVSIFWIIVTITLESSSNFCLISIGCSQVDSLLCSSKSKFYICIK